MRYLSPVIVVACIASLGLCGCATVSESHQGLTLEGRKYKQLAEPSEMEKQEGLSALALWKASDVKTRRDLADKIVRGKVLIGKSERELRDDLGDPVAPKSADGYMDWNAAGTDDKFAHRCLLSVRIKLDKVSDSYIFDEK